MLCSTWSRCLCVYSLWDFTDVLESVKTTAHHIDFYFSIYNIQHVSNVSSEISRMAVERFPENSLLTARKITCHWGNIGLEQTPETCAQICDIPVTVISELLSSVAYQKLFGAW